jgi:EAL domain-containing protein (putative c-di-GMP-specific phosphodiesterase class I)
MKQRINGFEALTYWKNSTLGVVAPQDFIAIAESSGLVAVIDMWKIKEGCKTLQHWASLHDHAMIMTLDISFDTLLCDGLLSQVDGLLQQHHIEAKQLEFSFSEFVAMKASEKASQSINNLIELGIKISINNFGVGYSSLNLLRSLPIQALRIDRTFIRDLHIDEDDQVIVKMIVHLAQLLNIGVVADGVESEKNLRFLHQLGCRYMQGTYFTPLLDNSQSNQLLEHGLEPSLFHCIQNNEPQESLS